MADKVAIVFREKRKNRLRFWRDNFGFVKGFDFEAADSLIQALNTQNMRTVPYRERLIYK